MMNDVKKGKIFFLGEPAVDSLYFQLVRGGFEEPQRTVYVSSSG